MLLSEIVSKVHNDIQEVYRPLKLSRRSQESDSKNKNPTKGGANDFDPNCKGNSQHVSDVAPVSHTSRVFMLAINKNTKGYNLVYSSDKMDSAETRGAVVIIVNGLPPSISLTFSVSMTAGVKSSSGDLWISTQDTWPDDAALIFLCGR
ncbi:hypothetical protein F2P81_002432 [Scophthalmus maximus]|uniref:Uncharacterized protein n=1 Tax=Scophthalmus maximus TaxID=52904 RepID=A0A6A4TIR7_SCOMX|nr:hypothetical protein F2P81_002432 [Scophthalmus maximus]